MEKRLRAILLSSLMLAITAAPSAQAKKAKLHHEEQLDYAKVSRVTPIYETVRYSEPYEECRYEERTVRHHNNSKTAIILGSIIGGAIGNELGHNKSNKRVGTVAGAILGGSIARDINHGKRTHHVRNEKVCNTVYQERYEEEITGYDVKYRYRGVTYYTTMNEHPGKRLRVAISVRPVI